MAGNHLLGNIIIGNVIPNRRFLSVFIFVTAGFVAMMCILASQKTYPRYPSFINLITRIGPIRVADFHNKVSTHWSTTHFEGVEKVDVGSLSGK